MFKNSSELLDCALREFQAAIDSGKTEVKIVVKQYFKGNTEDMQKIGKELEIKDIVELLREEFSEYDIKTRLQQDSLSSVISFVNKPCRLTYNLVLKSILTKKE